MSEPSLSDPSPQQWQRDPRLMPRLDWIECQFGSDADVAFTATLVEAAARASNPVATSQRR